MAPDPVLYKESVRTLKAQSRACETAKVDLANGCFFDFMPEKQLISWLEQRHAALQKIHNSKQKTCDYDILHKAHVLTNNISRQEVKYNNKKGQKHKKFIKYNIFGTTTGRLTTSRDSLPILTMKKSERNLLEPQNDLFLELDLNGAEIRTLMALSGQHQPDIDIHEWNLDNIFSNLQNREQAKKEFFAWFYNPSMKNNDLEKFYNKNAYKNFLKGDMIHTPYGRKIKSEERKAQNYLLQSTTSDIVIENSYNIMNYLKKYKSRVAFLMHDSVVLDFSKSEYGLVRDIKEMFENNEFGKFKTNIKIGKNFGDMRKVEI